MNTETQIETPNAPAEASAPSTEARVNAWTEKHGITMQAAFVPFSKSRNTDQKHPSLNWFIALHKNGRVFLTLDYMQGSGHAPANNDKRLTPLLRQMAIKDECEHGKEIKRFMGGDYPIRGKAISPPSIVDVLACIVMDASAIDSPTYEDWASELGYDADSRKGEAIYRECLEHGLKLRAAVGDQGLQKLREATQDW